jgi:hypothetical protein
VKLRTHHDGWQWTCIDDETCDGPGGVIGSGVTEEEAKADFMDQQAERESARDCRRAVDAVTVWSNTLEGLFQREFK